LKYLIRAECNRQCYARFRHHTKPKAAGSLAFVTVTNDLGKQQPILDKDELEHTLLEYSRTHFARAEGSPFTRAPLNYLLQYDDLISFGDRISNSKSNSTIHNFNEPTKAILQNLRRKLPDTPDNDGTLDYTKMIDGIRKWPERTTTSPSGRHLGIYKSLSKHIDEKKDNPSQTSTDDNTQSGVRDGHAVLFLIFDIMQLALNHAYPLHRWRRVWTLFIEKDLGNPDLNKLRCIMIFKADWQLLLKSSSSYGFLPQTEQAGMLVDAQGGGRKGRSAIDQATQQVLETKIVHLNQQPTLDMYLDLRTCFDLMVEACHNLACRRHGAADAYHKLHHRSGTLCNMCGSYACSNFLTLYVSRITWKWHQMLR